MLTEPYASFDEITRLGARIVDELGATESTDTLTRWMAHRAAELLAAADDERARGSAADAEAAAQRCQDAILTLWHHRSSWPQGWPPPRARKITELLADLPEPEEVHWRPATILAALQAAHYGVIRTLVSFAAADESPIEQAWLDTFGEHLTDAERQLLQLVIDAPRYVLLSEPDEEGPTNVFSKLIEQGEEYYELIADFVDQLTNVGDDDVTEGSTDEDARTSDVPRSGPPKGADTP